MKIYNPTVEERAFLYQEVQGLESLLKDFGSLTIVVEQSEPRKSKSGTTDGNQKVRNENFRVTFNVAPESMGMKVEAVGPNLFEATIAAKEETQKVLNALVNSLPRDWNAELEAIKIPRELLH